MNPAVDPKIARQMAIYQIRRYLNRNAAGAKLSAADILNHVCAFRMVARSADRIHLLVSLLEDEYIENTHIDAYNRLLRRAARQNPHLPHIDCALHEIMAAVAAGAGFADGQFRVSLDLSRPSLR